MRINSRVTPSSPACTRAVGAGTAPCLSLLTYSVFPAPVRWGVSHTGAGFLNSERTRRTFWRKRPLNISSTSLKSAAHRFFCRHKTILCDNDDPPMMGIAKIQQRKETEDGKQTLQHANHPLFQMTVASSAVSEGWRRLPELSGLPRDRLLCILMLTLSGLGGCQCVSLWGGLRESTGRCLAEG